MKRTIILSLVLMLIVTCTVLPDATLAADSSAEAFVPQGLTARAVDYQTVKLDWNKVSGAEGYKVYMSGNAASDYLLKASITNADDTDCTITGMPTGTTKYFKVAAYGTQEAAQASSGDTASAASAEDTAAVKTASSSSAEVTGVSSAVAAKTSLSATSKIWRSGIRTNTKGYISWNKVEGANGYFVYRYKNGSYHKVNTTASRSLYQSSLKKGGKTYYRVKAYRNVSGRAVTSSAKTAAISMPSKITSSTSGYSATYGARIIKRGRTKLGCRYVWGASGPNRFDCSGFTYWTMRHAGVSGVKFSRTSSRGIYKKYKRYSLGRSLSKAQSGDILIFGRSGSARHIFHVGIYYSNGNYIHANGHKVTISDVPNGQLVAVIRMPGLR